MSKSRPTPSKSGSTKLGKDDSAPSPFVTINLEDDPPPPRDPGDLAAIAMLEAAFGASPDVRELAGQGSTAIVVVTPSSWTRPAANAWATLVHNGEAMVTGDSPNAMRWRDSAEPPHVYFVRDDTTDSRKAQDGAANVTFALLHGGTVVGFSNDPATGLPAALLDAADATVKILPPDGRMLADVIKAMTGTDPSITIPDTTAAKISPDDLRLTVRSGQDANSAIRRLISMVGKRQTVPEITLAQMGGMEEAVTWGQSLAADLAAYRQGKLAWTDVDRGVLLSGPPGCGKTTFAKALAGSCGVPLVAASLGEWQAAGHLGDLLKAMRRTFDQARSASPAILLIDEIDGFGDRATLGANNRDYSVQVINGFLELLDGVASREGVIAVGATNHPGRIDPAITRSGRLDRHIIIGLPDEEGLIRIMRHHLGDELSTEDLFSAAKLALGGSGADVARWVRGAKRRGRQGGRAICVGDLIAEIRGNAPTVSDDILRRCAVHEAGHAIAIALVQPSTLRNVSIRQTATTGGGVISQRPDLELATSADIDQMLITLLAGRAAEEIILGTASSGAGGGVESDLAKATLMATSAITAMGLSGSATPIWSGMPSPDTIDILLSRRPDLARQVEDRLGHAYSSAKALITTHSESLLLIVNRLIEAETLSGDEVLVLLPVPQAPEQGT